MGVRQHVRQRRLVVGKLLSQLAHLVDRSFVKNCQLTPGVENGLRPQSSSNFHEFDGHQLLTLVNFCCKELTESRQHGATVQSAVA